MGEALGDFLPLAVAVFPVPIIAVVLVLGSDRGTAKGMAFVLAWCVGLTASAYQAMSRACKNAKVPHYSPHSLRHRRITIWHQSGVPARELAERAGHSKPSMSLDTYSHVMPADEITTDKVLSLL